MVINSKGMDYQTLNERIKACDDADITIGSCLGQRFIAAGLAGKNITIEGTPGNALGAYLHGANLTVIGNAQDATGDTMNDGSIVIYGSTGDTCGYAMRGGSIYVRDNAGYRAGIHMKAYNEKFPVMVIGGHAGSFLGEYQAGGVIIVLGLGCDKDENIVSNFCGTGMHGGKIYIRAPRLLAKFPPQVHVKKATDDDIKEIEKYIDKYCKLFSVDLSAVLAETFWVLTPNTDNPYKQLYVQN